MRSKNGLIFGVINVIGNFATVFQDQAYWQRAIASRPASCVKAYLLGGIAWFAIPFMFSTTLGLAAVALRDDPSMRVLLPKDVSAGLPAPSAAAALLGKSGAAAVLVVLFLAVTSATSAELIAVSSILTYDIYKRYFNPKATESQVLAVSHASVALFAVIMGLLGLIFFYIGISMGWLYTFMGVILGSAVVPIALAITWKKANKWGCIGGAIAGFVAGIVAWLVTTATLNNSVINVTTSGGDYEMLAGNLAAIGVGGIIATVASYVWPEDFNFDITRAINAPSARHIHERDSTEGDEDEKRSKEVVDAAEIENDESDKELDTVGLEKAFRFAAWSSVALTLVMIILIPLPLFFASTVYSVGGLSAWVVVGMIWTFCSAFIVVLYPLWESRVALTQIFTGIFKDIFSPGSGKFTGPVEASNP